LWCPRDKVLYWVDCVGKAIQRLHPRAGTTEKWTVSAYPGSLALREKGGLLVALRTGLVFFDPASGAETALGTGPLEFAKERFNDGKVDRRGRFWVGTIDRGMKAPLGSLYRVDPDLTVTRMDRGVTASNGIAWSPDDKTMYYCDSLPGLVHAYDFDIDSGGLRNKRVFIDLTHGPGRPDGCTVDAQGFLWVAEPEAARVARYDPGGKLERVVALPVTRPSSVIFGGDNLDTLYITSMRFGLSEQERLRYPLSGGLFASDPGVRGLPEPRFGG
jgi:sugar lactone lactonase YvrE